MTGGDPEIQTRQLMSPYDRNELHCDQLALKS